MSTMIRHHPDDATLLGYAAGSLPEPLAAVVASHLSMCPRCRDEVADLELLGAALMLTAPAGLDDRRLPVPRRPEEPRRPAAASRAATALHDRLPAPIADVYDLSFDRIPWKRLAPGVWHHRLALREPASGDLRLLRISGGRAMPDHGHGGTELTLVLEGAYGDATGKYRRGDVQDVDEAVDHQPVVDRDGECICLIASEHPARFKGIVGRLMQPWTGL